MRRAIITIGLAILLTGGRALATDFYSDGSIVAGDSWSNVSIYDTPPAHTTVNMTGGLVDGVATHDASTLNVHGGQVIYVTSVWNYSTVNIFDGSLGSASIHDYASINVYGGTFSQNTVVEDFGIANIMGGTMKSLSSFNYSVTNLYGGSITDSIYIGSTTSTINVFGSNLTKTDTDGTYGYGQISGFWQNGLPFTIDLADPDKYSRINLIPEPATFLLLGAGGLFLRKKG
ncbi:MAG: PEP-CTERM sorting domain-containing protein [Sedimentisphaerales bacterium]|jgi:hypothetical protein